MQEADARSDGCIEGNEAIRYQIAFLGGETFKSVKVRAGFFWRGQRRVP
jgi:hypothetical protein